MKFIVDECIGPSVARWLKQNNYDAVSVYDSLQSSSDTTVLEFAAKDQRILITCDKDFGDMIFRNKMKHAGIILVRLMNDQPANIILFIQDVLNNYTQQDLAHNFTVVTETSIRIIKL